MILHLPQKPDVNVFNELKDKYPEAYRYLCEVGDYLQTIWNFLQNPIFETLRFYPRSASADNEEGRLYYDSDTDKLNLYAAAYNPLHGFVNRGDPASADWTQATLTTDDTWRDLDCSSVVPAGAVLIQLQVTVNDDATNSLLQFRKNGNSNAINVQPIRTQVANISNDGQLHVACDANRVIEYKGSDLAFASIAVTITGWWI